MRSVFAHWSAVLALILSLNATSSAQVVYTWSGTTSAVWPLSTNWTSSGGTFPGSTTSTNTDTAIFAAAGSANTSIQMAFGTSGTPFYLGTIQQASTDTALRGIGSSTSTAGTIVLNGTGANNLVIDNESVAAMTLSPTVSSGTGAMAIQLAPSNSTINSVLGNSSTNTGILTISANVGEATAGNGITKTGPGILLLSGTNTFTGSTTISNGFIEYNAPASLYNGAATSSLTTSNLIVASGGALILRVGTGGFATTDVDNLKALGSATGGFLNGSGIGIDTSLGGLTYASNITDISYTGGSNSLALYKFGSNTLTPTGANTYTGGTFVRTGTLQLTGSQVGLPSGGNVTLGDPGAATNSAVLNIGLATQTSPSSYTLGSVTATGTGSAAISTFVLNSPTTASANTTTVTVNGAFTLTRATATTSGVNNTLILNGPLMLVGSVGGNTTFNATFNAPTLTNYASSTPISFSAQASGSNAGFLGTRLNLNNTTFTLGTSINQDANFTVGSTGTAQLTFQNSATLRLTNNVPVLMTTSLGSAMTNPMPIMGFGGGSGTPAVAGIIDTNGFGTTINTPITNVVSNTGGAISIIGSGSITIAGNNSQNGGVILGSGATLNINNSGVAAQPVVLASYSSGVPSVVVSASVISNLVLGQRLTGSGTTIAAGTFIRAIDTSSNTVYLSQNTAGAGTNLASSATSSLGTGTFTINGGTIDNTSVNPVTLATNNAQSWAGDFTFTGTNNLNMGTGAVAMTASRTVTTNSSVLTIGGAIGDGGSGFLLTKNGAGTLATTGINTYGGGTVVNNGNFQVQSGSLSATGAVSVNGGSVGGTLSGTGTIGGAVTVGGGTVPGTISAGNAAGAAGTLTLSNGLTTTGNGRIAVQILNGLVPGPGAPDSGASTVGPIPNPTSNNFLDIIGPLNLSAGSTVQVYGTGVNFDTTQTYSFQVGLDNSTPSAFSISTLSQFNFVNFGTAPSSASFDVTSGGEMYLNFGFTSVPEPSFCGLLMVGSGIAGIVRTRRWLKSRSSSPKT